jgi:hypothetical protein
MQNILFDTQRGDTKTIDGMVIGGTTPVAGSFTSLSATGALIAASVAIGGLPIASANVLAAATTSTPAAITAQLTNVTTADGTHIAVILPTGVAGDLRLVYNSGGASAQTASVYCQSTDTIDGGSAGGHVTLTVAHRASWFYCVAANTWISALVGSVST